MGTIYSNGERKRDLKLTFNVSERVDCITTIEIKDLPAKHSAKDYRFYLVFEGGAVENAKLSKVSNVLSYKNDRPLSCVENPLSCIEARVEKSYEIIGKKIVTNVVRKKKWRLFGRELLVVSCDTIGYIERGGDDCIANVSLNEEFSPVEVYCYGSPFMKKVGNNNCYVGPDNFDNKNLPFILVEEIYLAHPVVKIR